MMKPFINALVVLATGLLGLVAGFATKLRTDLAQKAGEGEGKPQSASIINDGGRSLTLRERFESLRLRPPGPEGWAERDAILRAMVASDPHALLALAARGKLGIAETHVVGEAIGVLLRAASDPLEELGGMIDTLPQGWARTIAMDLLARNLASRGDASKLTEGALIFTEDSKAFRRSFVAAWLVEEATSLWEIVPLLSPSERSRWVLASERMEREVLEAPGDVLTKCKDAGIGNGAVRSICLSIIESLDAEPLKALTSEDRLALRDLYSVVGKESVFDARMLEIEGAVNPEDAIGKLGDLVPELRREVTLSIAAGAFRRSPQQGLEVASRIGSGYVRLEAFRQWGEVLAAQNPIEAWRQAASVGDPLGSAAIRSAALNSWALTDYRAAATALLDSDNSYVIPETIESLVRIGLMGSESERSLAEAIREKFGVILPER